MTCLKPQFTKGLRHVKCLLNYYHSFTKLCTLQRDYLVQTPVVVELVFYAELLHRQS